MAGTLDRVVDCVSTQLMLATARMADEPTAPALNGAVAAAVGEVGKPTLTQSHI
jgi:hypothetical protein